MGREWEVGRGELALHHTGEVSHYIPTVCTCGTSASLGGVGGVGGVGGRGEGGGGGEGGEGGGGRGELALHHTGEVSHYIPTVCTCGTSASVYLFF